MKFDLKSDLNTYLQHFPRNDTYLLTNEFGEQICVDGQPEVFRQWGNSHIFIGYHGEHIIRFEPHIIPVQINTRRYRNNDICPDFGKITVARLVAAAWKDDYKENVAIQRKDLAKPHPNSFDNLIFFPARREPYILPRNAADYDLLDLSTVEFV